MTAILIAALLVGGLARAWAVFTKPVLYHDESHSYQAATGHVGDAARITYGRQPPYGQWTPARDWKRLLRPERPFCFVTISKDALAYDVHPPAYYWLLHLACLSFGSHPWTGVLLNSLLDGVTLFAIYRFARYVTGDKITAAVAAFVWATSAAAIQVAVVEARQYSLLALIGVMFCHRLARLFHEPGRVSRTDAAALFALTAAGALTHHHFAILVAGALCTALPSGLLPLPVLRERQSGSPLRRLAISVPVIAAAYIAIVIIHPVFYGTGFKHLSDAKLPDPAGLGARARQAAEALAHLFLERRFGEGLPTWLIAFVAHLVPLALVLAWRRTRSPLPRYALLLGTWLLAVTFGLYLVGITPAHAMSYRYLAMAWPFVALAIAMVTATDFPRAIPRGAAVCLLFLATGVTASFLQWHNLQRDPRGPEADRLLRGAAQVIVDNVGRGHWPRPVWRLREDAQLIVATPNDLLRRPAPWRAQLRPGAVYVSPARSAVQSRAKIVESLRKDHDVEEIGHLFGIGDVFLIGEPRGARRAPQGDEPRVSPGTSGALRTAKPRSACESSTANQAPHHAHAGRGTVPR